MDCVIGAFIGFVICVKLVLFGSLDDIGLLMTGNNDGLLISYLSCSLSDKMGSYTI